MNQHGTTAFLEDNPQARFDRNPTAHVVNTAPCPCTRGGNGCSRAIAPVAAGTLETLSEMDGVPAGLFEQWWTSSSSTRQTAGRTRRTIRGARPHHGAVRASRPARAHLQAARLLARQRAQRPCARVDVFVHDFNRWTEKEASLLFLAPHARLANYEGIVQDGRPDRGAEWHTSWFHAP